MIIDVHDIWEDAKQLHEKYILEQVDSAMRTEYSRGPATRELVNFQCFLDAYLEEIVDSSITAFDAIINGFRTYFPPGSPYEKKAHAIAERVFDYTSFSKATSGWTAYELCIKARYKVCPYCHLSMTDTVKKSGTRKGYRPQLDHYLAKAQFPYLALSLGNIVPSCERCNGSSAKHTKDFFTHPHLNPLKDASALSFRLRPARGAEWTPTLHAMIEPVAQYEIEIETTPDSLAARNSLDTFQLEERYQGYVHDAYRIARYRRRRGWHQSVRKEIDLDITIEDELGFSLTENGFKNSPGGKMRLDIYKSSNEA